MIRLFKIQQLLHKHQNYYSLDGSFGGFTPQLGRFGTIGPGVYIFIVELRQVLIKDRVTPIANIGVTNNNSVSVIVSLVFFLFHY